MKQKQHIFQSWAIEVVTVLLASTISFPVSDALGMQLSTLPFIMVACYVALKLIYHLCLSLSAHIISLAGTGGTSP
jgi:antirestriction protein